MSTEDSRSSFTGTPVMLADHLRGVAAAATGCVERLGLPETISRDLRIAAEWHDTGKADVRFQCWLHGGSGFKALAQAHPLAKSAVRPTNRAALRLARERAGYPEGGRHELVSLALLHAAAAEISPNTADWCLVQHLVASHHGHCRPFAPFVHDDRPIEVTYQSNGAQCRTTSAHGFERLDSGVAERFWLVVRRYGWWGAAWLEAILRLADHRQSRHEGVKATTEARHA